MRRLEAPGGGKLSPARRRRPEPRAFTLIELLTVISILSVLMALLMPAMSGARQRGRIAKCQAAIRELARATLSYGAANQDVFPLARDCQNGRCVFWNGHQYYGWNGTKLNPLGREWVRPVNVELGIEPSPPSVASAKFALCPDDEGAPGESGSFDPLYEVLGTSYPLNPILCQGRYGVWRYRDRDLTTSQVVDVSRKVLLFDHPAFGLTFDGYWTAVRPGWHDKISPAAGVAFIDGHAEYVKGRCALGEWQWYAEAPGPEWVRQLARKIDWPIWPECR